MCAVSDSILPVPVMWLLILKIAFPLLRETTSALTVWLTTRSLNATPSSDVEHVNASITQVCVLPQLNLLLILPRRTGMTQRKL